MTVFSWALTALGTLSFWLCGSGKRAGWALALGTQGLWVVYSILTRQWAFLAGALFYAIVFARNLVRHER